MALDTFETLCPIRPLDVKTRQIIYIRMEQIWLLLMPLLQRRHGADVAACALRDVVMVDADVADQGVVQVLAGMAAVGGQDLGEAAVAARDPAVGLGVARCDEAMRDGVGGADAIERVLTGRCALAGGAAPVGERLAVVGQDLSYLERSGPEEAFEKAMSALSVGLDYPYRQAGGISEEPPCVPTTATTGYPRPVS